ncbi:MAG: hypothetical protein KDB00_14860 [Planctomycetales bacterium]|nr:hypothetical protein [Planctomycetales bacterium]
MNPFRAFRKRWPTHVAGRKRLTKPRGRRPWLESLESRQLLAVDATMGLGPGTLNGQVAEFEVSINFAADAGERLTFFSLDVSPSSDQLGGSNSDYSRFSFEKATPLLDDWRQIGFFNDPVFESSVEFDDSLIAPISPGSYSLGTLRVDLASGTGILGGSILVSISGPQTVIGVEDSSGNFHFEPVSFQPPTQTLAALEINGPQTIAEGSTYRLTVDTEIATDGTINIQWGDGVTDSITVTSLATSNEISHVFADGDSTPTIFAELRLPDGTQATTTELPILVSNVSPQFELSGGDSVDEGSAYVLTLGAVSDPGDDTVTEYQIDWGDGQSDTVLASALPANRQVNHVYSDGPATRTISATVTDEDGVYPGVDSLTVEVQNVAPMVTLTGDNFAKTNEPYVLTIGPTVDPGDDAVIQFIVDWGDGSQDVILSSDLPSNRQVTHTYAEGDVQRLVFVDIVDEDGRYPAVTSLELFVERSIDIEVVVSGPDVITEGDIYLLNIGPITGPGSERVTTVVVDWGDQFTDIFPLADFSADGNFGHVYQNGPVNVTITVQFRDVTETSLLDQSKPVQVLGVPLTIDDFDNTASRPGETDVGDVVTAFAEVTRPSLLNHPRATIDWGDGTVSQTVTIVEQNGIGIINQTHVFTTGGIFTVRLTVEEDFSLPVTAETTAFVTGTRLDRKRLQIVGSSGNDIVTVTPAGSGQIFVNMTLPGTGNIRQSYPLANIAGLDVYVGSGNDRVMISDRLTIETLIDGGSDDDILQGSSGANLILGGPGDDEIAGGNADDILIGDAGRNLILGYEGDDLLVGATWSSSYSDRTTALSIWNSAGSFDERKQQVLENFMVSSDFQPDSIYGGVGQNLFILSTNDSFAGRDNNLKPLTNAIEAGWTIPDTPSPGVFTFEIDDVVPIVFTVGTTNSTELLLDTNLDGKVSIVDALVVINALSQLSAPEGEAFATLAGNLRRLDTSRDGRVTAMDALVIINEISKQTSPSVSGDGESVGIAADQLHSVSKKYRLTTSDALDPEATGRIF